MISSRFFSDETFRLDSHNVLGSDWCDLCRKEKSFFYEEEWRWLADVIGRR